jgi:myxalamid-type polyketide synthase MxaB
MAAGTEERNRARFAEVGLASIEPEVGLAIFAGLLDDPAPPAQIGVLPVTWSRWTGQFRDGAPPFFSALVQRDATPRDDDDDGAILQQLADAEPEALRDVLLTWLRDQLARVLGFSAGSEVDPAREFVDMGIDSLLAVDLRNRLESSLAIDLPATLVFDHPTLDAVVDHLVETLTADELSADELSMLDEIEELTEEEAARQLATDEPDV